MSRNYNQSLDMAFSSGLAVLRPAWWCMDKHYPRVVRSRCRVVVNTAVCTTQFITGLEVRFMVSEARSGERISLFRYRSISISVLRLVWQLHLI